MANCSCQVKKSDSLREKWHFGEITCCQATIVEAISLAKELNDPNGLALALYFSAYIAHYRRNPVEVERFASDLIELSTHQNLAFWLPGATVLRGWARSASGFETEGFSWSALGKTLAIGRQDLYNRFTTPKEIHATKTGASENLE